jgi:predicted lactoylglutathione lyase
MLVISIRENLIVMILARHFKKELNIDNCLNRGTKILKPLFFHSREVIQEMLAHCDANAPKVGITELPEEHGVLYREVGNYFLATTSSFARPERADEM